MPVTTHSATSTSSSPPKPSIARSHPVTHAHTTTHALRDEASETNMIANETKFRALLREKKSCYIVDQAGDGNCLFRSIAHQVYGDAELHLLIRDKCLSYIEKEAYFFESYITGDFHEYLTRMRRDGEWGDHVEIQAASELYGRPVQVFAYSITPMKTYQNNNAASISPILLSYHFKSHYNSIVHPVSHKQNLLSTTPGDVEDAAIKRSCLNHVSDMSMARHLFDVERTELATVTRALELSRQGFENTNTADLDRALQASLAELEKREEEVVAALSRDTLRAYEEEQLLAAALQASEDDLLNQAKSKSLQGSSSTSFLGRGGGGGFGRVEEGGKDVLPGPVQRCMELGFPLDVCVVAYSIFSDASDASENDVTQNMLAYIMGA